MYQPKTGKECSCKRGVQRDNCPACEGTGQMIDFAAIRARNDRHRVTAENVDKHNALVNAMRGIYGMDCMKWPAEASQAVEKAHSFLFGNASTEF